MINLTVVIDNDEALKKLKELQRVAKTTTSSVVTDAERMDDAFSKINKTIGSLVSLAALKEFSSRVIGIRGEVQKLEVAFETMLGSKAKADALMTEAIDLAAKTPFGLQDVSNATKMLLAYGSTAENVADEIKMLGNIASGLSIPLNDMIYLYGTTRTQGRMFTQDLRQFMGRGIPLAEELAKQFGVTKDEVGALVTAGKVGFPEMQKALQSMTSEGGQFFNLMDKQSQTIAGQISNLEDAIYQMFNKIGESQEETISKGISFVSMLVENYERVGRILVGIIATYGAYRAAMILTAATAKGYTIAQLAQYSALVAVEKAQKLLNATMLKNPYVLAATLVAGLVTLLISQKNETERLKEAQEAYNEEKDKVIAKEEEHKRWIEKLTSIAEDEAQSTDERRKALTALEIKYPEIFEKYDTEYSKLQNIKQIKEDIAELEGAKSITNPKNELADVERRINELIALGKTQKVYTDRYGTYTTVDRGLNKSEEARLKALQKRKAELLKEIRNNDIQGIIDSADKLSDAQLKAITEKLKREQNKRSGVLPFNMVLNPAEYITGYGDWSDEQLQAYLQKIQRVSNERGLPKMTPEEDVERLKKEYEAAQKALDDFEKSKDKLTAPEIEEKRKKLTEERDTRKKAYETAAGSTVKQREEEKQRKELIKDLLKLGEEYAQAEVDLIKDGDAKKLAQIELDYQKEKNAIQKEVEEIKKLQGGKLTSEQEEKFNVRFSAADSKRQQKIEEAQKETHEATESELRDLYDYYKKYGVIQEKILAATNYYESAIANAKTEGERKALEAERDATLAEYKMAASEWGQEILGMTVKEITKLANQLEIMVAAKQKAKDALADSDSEEAKKLQEEINNLNAQIALLKERLGEAQKEAKNENWDETVRVFQEIISTAKDAASSLSEVDESLGKMASGLVDLASFGLNAATVIKKLTTGLKGLELASAILTVISLGVQLVSGIVSRIVDANKQYKETIENFKALNKELEQMHRLANINSLEGTIFGEDAFGNYVNNLNVMRDATKAYEESMEAVANRAKTVGEVFGAKYGSQEFKNQLVEFERHSSLYESLSQMLVQLSSRKTSTLGEQLPDLFAGGEVTLEGLKKLQQSDVWDKLSKENRDLIEQMIADWEYYNESVGAVNDYLKGIFGDFGETMTNILVDSFNEGTDAALEFGDAMADIIDRLTKEFIYSAFIKDFVDTAQAQVDALNEEDISGEEKVKRLVGILKQLSNDVLAAQEDVNATLEQMESEGYGVDRSSGQQSASSGGFKAMSQETGSELNGRFTDIQGKVTYINEAVQFMKSLSASQLQQTTSISETVALIHNDTSRIEQHTRVLAQMAADIASIKSDISNGGY